MIKKILILISIISFIIIVGICIACFSGNNKNNSNGKNAIISYQKEKSDCKYLSYETIEEDDIVFVKIYYKNNSDLYEDGKANIKYLVNGDNKKNIKVKYKAIGNKVNDLIFKLQDEEIFNDIISVEFVVE